MSGRSWSFLGVPDRTWVFLIACSFVTASVSSCCPVGRLEESFLVAPGCSWLHAPETKCQILLSVLLLSRWQPRGIVLGRSWVLLIVCSRDYVPDSCSVSSCCPVTASRNCSWSFLGVPDRVLLRDCFSSHVLWCPVVPETKFQIRVLLWSFLGVPDRVLLRDCFISMMSCCSRD